MKDKMKKRFYLSIGLIDRVSGSGLGFDMSTHIGWQETNYMNDEALYRSRSHQTFSYVKFRMISIDKIKWIKSICFQSEFKSKLFRQNEVSTLDNMAE